jgi:hypothetical protein
MTQAVTLTEVRNEQVTQLQSDITAAASLAKQAAQQVLAVVRGDL